MSENYTKPFNFDDLVGKEIKGKIVNITTCIC